MLSMCPTPLAAPSLGSSSLSEAISELEVITGALRNEFSSRRAQDNLVFARLKEDQDFAYNRNREDRFTVTGLRVTEPPPRDALERKEFFRNLLASMILEACPDLDPQPQILDVFVNMRYGRGAPFIEARLDSVVASSAFRVAAAKLAKVENSNFSGVFIANSVTLTTRVRIEILRAIAKKLTTLTEESLVQGFSSRPMLHYQSRENVLQPASGTNRSYSFVEAVGRWGDQLSTVELLPAYRRARPAFIGCLEQYFVVLKESEPLDASASGFDQLFGSNSNFHPVGSSNGRFSCRGSRPPFLGGRSLAAPCFNASRFSGRGAPSASSVPPPVRKRLASNDVESSPSKRMENKDDVTSDQDNIMET